MNLSISLGFAVVDARISGASFHGNSPRAMTHYPTGELD